MGLFDFVKDAGARLFGIGETEADKAGVFVVQTTCKAEGNSK